MIGALISCAIALAVFLVVASMPFLGSDIGRTLRHAGFGLFFGVFGLSVALTMLRALLPLLLADWRFYAFLIVASPIAYLLVEARRRALKSAGASDRKPLPTKRRDGGAPRSGHDESEAP